jgi:hypothetical protein
MAGGAVARAYGLVLVEHGLPRVVVTYLVLNDDDHDCLLSPNTTDHPLQTDLTNPGRLTPAFSATEDHVRWPEALR